ncbi:MAG: hypothetical protein DRQ51_04030 [Gammaproteobacteria bacterium]|nr:MAG: hypothetical protein DRQ51_04030 [Gammaproteobacteria bacterium]
MLEYFKKFPMMVPRIGCDYKNKLHKRLLIVGESHYLPNESSTHLNSENWYRDVSKKDLTVKEIQWISTENIITSSLKDNFKNKAHWIYKNIAYELNESGLKLDNFRSAINHICYYNYFLRPAKQGKSLEVAKKDIETAEEVLKWFIEKYKPELIIFTSSLAGIKAKPILDKAEISYVITPHPTCQWWNRIAKKYGNIRGRDLFRKFLNENKWHNV